MTNRLRQWLRIQWCSWTHGGGHVVRDPLGRINWRCAKCGLWCVPVGISYEIGMTNAAIAERAKRMGE